MLGHFQLLHQLHARVVLKASSLPVWAIQSALHALQGTTSHLLLPVFAMDVWPELTLRSPEPQAVVCALLVLIVLMDWGHPRV